MSQKNDKRNQHYVPKCYLRNFTDGDEFIATYMHSKSKFVQRAGLDSVASKEYFYGKDLIIENYFEKLEGEWAKAFRIIIDEKNVTQTDFNEAFYNIMTFIAFQSSRTLRTYDGLKEFDIFMKKHIHEHSANQDNANELLQRYFPDGYNIMEAPVSVSYNIIERFKTLNFLCIKNDTKLDFITSDNPVAMYNKFLIERRYKGSYGFNSAGIIFFVPLSPQICICLFDSKTYFSTNKEIFYNAAENDVKELNKMFCRNAYEFIFFSKKHTEQYAQKLDKSFVDRLQPKTRIINSNLGPVINLHAPSILEVYEFPFITVRKSCKRIPINEFGPAPERNFKKTK